MKKTTLAILALLLCAFTQYGYSSNTENKVRTVRELNPTAVEVIYENNQRMLIDFYGENIFRLFQDNNGGIARDPKAKPEAKILVDNPRKAVSKLNLTNDKDWYTVKTNKVEVRVNKGSGLLQVINTADNRLVLEELNSKIFEDSKTTLFFKENENEYFYGGGVQNGRFSHKGKAIAIENQNSWTDGGVASPNPYYWSTNGYGLMWHTFKKGEYDFGAKEKGKVGLRHDENYLDVFVMVNSTPIALLNDFYQLTGNPVLMPKFGFFQGHLNAYNRDYWAEDENGILFEDGKRYKESQKDNGGIKESLNGELNNYQFSARAVIDRYKNNDMPLGWLLPNDGYGAGYGQTKTLDGNIENLRSLAEYAQKNGVEIGLWTQSDLHPKPEIEALLQRDIVKEVRDAGVRVLKTDVAWVGAGYSFGLNGVTDAAQIMTYYGNSARPFIISLDGWAGTQRYAGIWSGDQTGGVWEYIRFHIPTYIGSGLSGNPNISSDMDGIFGGKNPLVNIRDFQWKTFTPTELNMDGWGANEKYPHALGEPATSINRHYLKWKSELMPYTYSIAKESVDGLPMIRAMFLEYPNKYTHGRATQYQFLYGPNFLVAPIYQETAIDATGNDIRNGIYLPEGQWIDYFSGDLYRGECIINNFDAPLWKLPVFVKNGAIIPLSNPNNNVSEINQNLRIYEIYPYGYSSFTEYDDDGISEAYRLGKGVTTEIKSDVNNKTNIATITIEPSTGEFDNFVREKATEFRINVTQKPKQLDVAVGAKKVTLKEVTSLPDFEKGENVFYYNPTPDLNKFATAGSDFANVVIAKNPQLWVKIAPTNVTENSVSLIIKRFVFAPENKLAKSSGSLVMPTEAGVKDDNRAAYTLKPTWATVPNADFYEIEFDNMLYTTIKENELLFELLEPETEYLFKLRAVNKDGASDWTSFKATTKSNPLEFAIPGIKGETTAANQGRSLSKLFDFQEGDLWHTKYQEKATPFDLIMDLKTINKLEKLHYVPRDNAGNGTILKGSFAYSLDKKHWIDAGTFEWDKDNLVKIFNFANNPSARYIKMNITESVGDYGSGKEIYVFKVPGTESYLPGDINNDGKIDQNDLTSYINYTGLRKGDADFEGYVSVGDINKNGLIDAYDISVVATQLNGGVDGRQGEPLMGTLELSTPKQNYDAGEIIELIVKGIDLQSVNALSFALPYNPQDYEFIGIESLNTKAMENMSKDRLHTNGDKALYPTFVNLGTKELLNGTEDLFIIKLKTKKKKKFDLKMLDSILVDRNLNSIILE